MPVLISLTNNPGLFQGLNFDVLSLVLNKIQISEVVEFKFDNRSNIVSTLGSMSTYTTVKFISDSETAKLTVKRVKLYPAGINSALKDFQRNFHLGRLETYLFIFVLFMMKATTSDHFTLKSSDIESKTEEEGFNFILSSMPKITSYYNSHIDLEGKKGLLDVF